MEVEHEIIEFYDGLFMHRQGEFYLPENAKAGVIVTHSYRESCETEPICQEVIRPLTESGLAVLTFDLVGHDKHNPLDLANVSYYSIEVNVASALNYMRQEKQITTIGMLSISLSTFGAVLNAIDIDAHIMISPLTDMGLIYTRYKDQIDRKIEAGELSEKGYVELESQSGRGRFVIGEKWIEDMTSRVASITGEYHNSLYNLRNALLIHGDADTLISHKRTEAIGVLYDNVSLHIIPGADHNLTNPEHCKKVVNIATRWFERHLLDRDVSIEDLLI